MKKLFIVFVSLLLPICLAAQNFAVDKGSIALGGSLSYVSRSGDLHEDVNGDGTTIISFTPNVLYFILPNIGIGAQFGYTNTSQGDLSESILGVGPQIGYFAGTAGSAIFPFVSGSYNFLNKSGDVEDSSGSEIQIGGGAVFMIARNIGITAMVFYSLDSEKEDGEDDAVKGSQIGFRAGVSAFIW